MKRFALAALTLLTVCSVAQAFSISYGWEDGNTILGEFAAGQIIESNVTSPVHSGLRSLEVKDNAPSGTPQAYVAWITGLEIGDMITADFWCYDATPDASPSGRIWGHYTYGSDINNYAGSAGGNNTYSDGFGWSNLAYTWTVAQVSGYTAPTGLVVEVRTYSNPGDTVWADDLCVIAPDKAGISITTPGGTAAVPEPSAFIALTTGLIGLFSFASRRRTS